MKGGLILACRERVNDRAWVVDDESSSHKARQPTKLNVQTKALLIDQANKCLRLNGQKIELTPKEFELVTLLSSNVEHIYSAEEIIGHLWPDSDRADKSDLYQYMHMLRKKIEKDPNNPQWLRTVKGFGYKLLLEAEDKKLKSRPKANP